ncbi:MAG: sugar phosphate isomerase/epimerase family protein [Gemmataceae bacterium]
MPRIFYSVIIVLSVLTTYTNAQTDNPNPFRPKFYAFQNGVSFGSFEKEAKVLKNLGYDGISQVFSGGKTLATRIAAYDKVGLKVLSIYLNVDDKPIQPNVVQPLQNRGGMIELTIRRMTPKTVNAVRQTAEMAAKMKIRVAIYPHHGFAVATMPQAMALIKKVDHPNLGVMFNLCHFLRNEKAENLEKVLKKAGSRLFAVSTCGADLDGKGWSELIQTLDRGSFPQRRLFAALKKLNYQGPVGLQCYAIRGDKRTNLQKSMAAWKKILKKL